MQNDIHMLIRTRIRREQGRYSFRYIRFRIPFARGRPEIFAEDCPNLGFFKAVLEEVDEKARLHEDAVIRPVNPPIGMVVPDEKADPLHKRGLLPHRLQYHPCNREPLLKTGGRNRIMIKTAGHER